MVICVLETAMTVVGDGISPSMGQNAQLQQPLTVWSTCDMELAGKKIYIVCDKLKESVRSQKGHCARGVLGRQLCWSEIS